MDQNGQGHVLHLHGLPLLPHPPLRWIRKPATSPKYYGRFNQGVVTINLPDVALSSGGDLEKFWKIFDERLELCYRALMCRHERLKGTPVRRGPHPVAVRRAAPG